VGYMFAVAPCILCHVPFAFNPDLVPSTSLITGHREPICESCMKLLNAKRAERGLAPFEIRPGAYEPANDGI
jgi:hypothetical protein